MHLKETTSELTYLFMGRMNIVSTRSANPFRSSSQQILELDLSLHPCYPEIRLRTRTRSRSSSAPPPLFASRSLAFSSLSRFTDALPRLCNFWRPQLMMTTCSHRSDKQSLSDRPKKKKKGCDRQFMKELHLAQ